MRVVIADHADAAPVPRATLLERWHTTTRAAETLHDQGVDVRFVGRTTGDAFSLTRAGLCFDFVHDRTRGLRRVARAVAAHRADVVHVHGLGFAAATLSLRAAERRAAIVVQHHGERPPAGARARAQQRLAAHAADVHLFTGGAAHARGFATRRVLDVLEASTDLAPVADRAAARARTGVHGDPAVLWVGRLVEGKDPATAAAVLARLRRTRPAAHLWVLCTEPPSPAARAALVAAAGDAGDHVHVHGPVPHVSMPDWFAAVDVALSTSRHEAAGFALLEALACGCPAAATALAPHRRIVGEPAVTFPPGDADAAVDAVLAALARRREAIAADFAARLSWPVVGVELRDAYAVASAARRRPRTRRRATDERQRRTRSDARS